MAGAGYLLFTAGQVLTAAQVNTYLNQQAVMVFATTAARDSALTSVKSEGMVTYQLDNNDLDIYNGSTFSTLIAPAHGALIAWTPVVVQSNTPTLTVTNSFYVRIGRFISFRALVNITSAGTASNPITITVPVASTNPSNRTLLGRGTIERNAVQYVRGDLVNASSTTMAIDSGNSISYLLMGAAVWTNALASGDLISVQGFYEAAADA